MSVLARTPGVSFLVPARGRAATLGRRATPAVWRPHPAVLDEHVAWWDAADGSTSGQVLPNRGWGVGLDAQLGSTTGADTNDPLWLPGAGAGYAYCTGGSATNYLTIPDAAAQNPTTSLDVRVAVTPADWTPASNTYYAGKYTTSGSQRAWRLGVETTGKLLFATDATGASPLTATSSVASALTDASLGLIRAVWAAATPSVTFYTKASTEATAYADLVSDSGWTQLGTTITGATVAASIFDSSSTVAFGGAGEGVSGEGRLYAAVLKVDGALVAGIDMATDCTSGAASSFTATTGQTVTVDRFTSGRKTALVPSGSRPRYLFGTNDYMEVADSDLIDFGATDSFTVWAVVRQWATPTSNGRYMNKRASTGAGWLLQARGTAQQGLFYFEGAGALQNITAAAAAGHLRLYAGIRDVGADTIASALNGTFTTPTTDTTTGSLANDQPFRIGCRSDSVNNVQDFEFLAAGICRRALTAGELYAIAQFYGSTGT